MATRRIVDAANGLIDTFKPETAGYLGPRLDGVVEQITNRWAHVFAGDLGAAAA